MWPASWAWSRRTEPRLCGCRGRLCGCRGGRPGLGGPCRLPPRPGRRGGCSGPRGPLGVVAREPDGAFGGAAGEVRHRPLLGRCRRGLARDDDLLACRLWRVGLPAVASWPAGCGELTRAGQPSPTLTARLKDYDGAWHRAGPRFHVCVGSGVTGLHVGARDGCSQEGRGGPISRVLSWTTIYLLRASPPASIAQPERGAGHTMALLFAFSPDGACQAAVLPRRWWSLTPPFQLFPLRGPKGPGASWSLLFCGAFRRVSPPGR